MLGGWCWTVGVGWLVLGGGVGWLVLQKYNTKTIIIVALTP